MRLSPLFLAAVLGFLSAAAAGEPSPAGAPPLSPDALTAAPLGVGTFPAGTVVAVDGATLLRRPRLGPDHPDRLPQPGDALFPGDELLTLADGMCEVVWGVNVRLRLGPNSHALLRSGHPLPAADGAVAPADDGIGQVEWRLAAGQLRARVRENILTPATLLLTTPRTLVFLTRGDVVFQTDAHRDQARIVDGAARIWTRTWQGEVSKGEGLSGAGMPSAWVMTTDDPLRAALRFTVDAARDALPQPP